MPRTSALTSAEVASIEKLLLQGVSVTAISERYDISDTVTYKIKNGTHTIQIQMEKLRQAKFCPECGRPFRIPCVVCQVQKNVATTGEFDASKWTKQGAR